MRSYHEQFSEIERKWQEIWQRDKVFAAEDFDSQKEKFFCLVEFPYPSGEGLHMGHPRSYYAMDIVCRKKRMQGKNVLYPIGWDAFGLPAEHYAIKTKQHPTKIVAHNVATFARQLKSLGISFDMSREINTTDPAYYQWTQWMFLKFHEKGLAYKAKFPINWCPSCKIGIAHEELEQGKCERCGSEVEQREKEQWILKMTEYADRLIDDLKEVDYINEVVTQQVNWIGRSYGAQLEFPISKSQFSIKVFTTRPDTLFGATYVVLSPEYYLLNELKDNIQNWQEVEQYREEAKKKTDLERETTQREKSGVKLEGVMAINPATKEKIPVFIADYVLAHYGTGAIMAVPAHDKRDFGFAQKFELPIRIVICPNYPEPICPILNQAYEGDGKLVDSGKFTGMDSEEAKKAITHEVGGEMKVTYRLRDWVFSRQRYWGEPIPMVHCQACGWVRVLEKDLPVGLPDVQNYEPTDTGESPLASLHEWVNTTCPQCGGPGTRETDTMPTWAGSSWYWLRYIDPHNNTSFADIEKQKYWTPVDLYNGGMEHATRHLLYARFWNKALFDQKFVTVSEPFRKRVSHGLILAENGQKMSKSKGNIINPDNIVREYGADTTKVYLMFMGPYDEATPWSDKGIKGAHRFLTKVWDWVLSVSLYDAMNDSLESLLHKTIKKVTVDIDTLRFNTAVSSLMIYMNEAQKESSVSREHLEAFLKILYPIAPHLACELWEQKIGQEQVYNTSWPVYDLQKIKDQTITIAVQVNGKIRAQFQTGADTPEEEIQTLALGQENVRKNMYGKKPKKIIYVKRKLVSIVADKS